VPGSRRAAGGVGASLVPALLQVGGEAVELAGERAGPGNYLAGGVGAGELADGVARQAQHLGDLGVVPALGEEVMDRGVALAGPCRQAAIAGALAPRRAARFGGYVAAGSGGLRIAGFGGGFPEVSAAGDDGFLYRAAEVLPEVEWVGHLDGIGGSFPGALGGGAGPAPADDLHAGVFCQPLGESLGLTVGHHVDGLVGVHVDEDGHTGLAAPLGEVVHAQHRDLADPGIR
jgi:hypothetical protein